MLHQTPPAAASARMLAAVVTAGTRATNVRGLRLAAYLPYLAVYQPEVEFERGLDILVVGLAALLDQRNVNVPL
jgi:hypothetical protein